MKIESQTSRFPRAARLWRQHIPAVLWVAMAALCPTACNDDMQRPRPQTDGHTAVIYLNFKTNGGPSKQAVETDASESPETRAPMTRAAVNQDAINTIDVLSFKADPTDPANIKKGTFFYRARGTYDAATRTVRVRLLGASEHQTLVVLANVREQVNALGAAYGEQKEEVMRRLTLPATADGTPDLTNGMPMWGELPAQIVNDSYGQTLAGAPAVTMIRPVAKVTLKSTNPPITHGIEEIHVYNHRTGGRISPDNYNNAGSKVFAPTVPTGTTAAAGNHINMNIPYFQTPNQASFYLFESDSRGKVTATSALAATCLVVKIKSSDIGGGGIGYYRIDFKDYATGIYLDLLRNHDYRIEVESIDGLPASTVDEAYKGSHTLKCRIVPWNEVQEEVKVSANKRLTVDKRSIRLKAPSATTTGETLTVTTENTGGWTITDVPSWLTVSPTSSTSDGTGTITIKSKYGIYVINNGSFKLKAGNAEMVIRVKLWKLPLEYVAEYNLAGGFTYGSSFNYSYPAHATPTAAQTDNALRWATSHANDQSGYDNWYVLKGIHDAAYNPNTKNLFSDSFFSPGQPGHGYHLPSRWEWMGVFSYNGQAYGSPNNNSVNEACEFGGIKKTFGADYISTGNGVCYALRFKKATGGPNDNSPISEFPQATDDSTLCAYRYTRVGSFNIDNNLTSQLKVDCVYLGEAGASTPISTISNDAWWSARASETVTRIFPAAGNIYPASVSGSSGTLNNRGHYGYCWSGTENGSSFAWYAYFYSNLANTYNVYGKNYGYAVRLFADE